MKTFDQLRERFVNESWETIKKGPGYKIEKDTDTGVTRKVSVDEKMDRDELNKAMAAFKAKGGKVTKAPAAKAQGYHGKEDPGADMHGMLDKGDTKKSVMGTRKKVKSVEATQVDEISKDTKKSYIKKAVGDIDNRSFAQGLRDKNPTYTSADSKNNRKIANRRKGIDRALADEKDKPPFDNPKPMQKDTKDKFGNPIKNRARHLARKAARDLLNKAK
jgi:hypothetical protein